MIVITILAGQESGQRFDCDEEVIPIGRGSSNLIALDDKAVSWQHGQITLREGKYAYRDLNSTNGSVIARGDRRWKLDRVLSELELQNGDRIAVGQTVLEVALTAPAEVRTLATRTLRSDRTDLASTEMVEIEQIYENLRKDRETLLTIYEMERQINVEFDPASIRQRVLEAVLGAFSYATSVSIATIEPDSQHITEVTSLAAPGGREEPLSHYMANRALQELRAVSFAEEQTERVGAVEVVSRRERCAMCAPLWTGSHTRGVIQVFSTGKPGRFSEHDLDLFTLFANRAATGLANAELNEEKQRTFHFQQLTDYLANDLRSAATGLVEWLKPLEDGLFGGLQGLQLEAVRSARVGAQIVSTMVTSMTDLSELREPDWAAKLEPVVLDEAAEVPVRLANEIAISHRVAGPVYRPRPALPPVSADRELLPRVILNLLLFGMTWGEASTPVVLESSREKDTAVLSVEWLGERIPTEHRDCVFEPDTQARLWKDLGRRSVGIGLAFSQLAMQKMGGRIWVDPSESRNLVRLSLDLAPPAS